MKKLIIFSLNLALISSLFGMQEETGNLIKLSKDFAYTSLKRKDHKVPSIQEMQQFLNKFVPEEELKPYYLKPKDNIRFNEATYQSFWSKPLSPWKKISTTEILHNTCNQTFSMLDASIQNNRFTSQQISAVLQLAWTCIKKSEQEISKLHDDKYSQSNILNENRKLSKSKKIDAKKAKVLENTKIIEKHQINSDISKDGHTPTNFISNLPDELRIPYQHYLANKKARYKLKQDTLSEMCNEIYDQLKTSYLYVNNNEKRKNKEGSSSSGRYLGLSEVLIAVDACSQLKEKIKNNHNEK